MPTPPPLPLSEARLILTHPGIVAACPTLRQIACAVVFAASRAPDLPPPAAAQRCAA